MVEKKEKETKEKKTTTRRTYTRKTATKKKEPVEVKKEELVETPIPKPEVIEDLKPMPISDAKPEKLETLVINEDLEDPECKKEDLGLITTGDLPPAKIAKPMKAHDAAKDIMITTKDFKPRTWGESKKL